MKYLLKYMLKGHFGMLECWNVDNKGRHKFMKQESLLAENRCMYSRYTCRVWINKDQQSISSRGDD